jgi:hypothetical protein
LSDADAIVDLTTERGYETTASDVAARLSLIPSRSDQQFLVAEMNRRPVGRVHAAIAECLEAETGRRCSWGIWRITSALRTGMPSVRSTSCMSGRGRASEGFADFKPQVSCAAYAPDGPAVAAANHVHGGGSTKCRTSGSPTHGARIER